MASFTPQTPAIPSRYAFIIPGVTPDTLQTTQQLLEKNHKEHDIFFNPQGFHNHLTHHFLAAYSMGANTERLKEIYDDHASYQRKLPPPVQDINRENFRSQLGNRAAYTSYLEFFQREIAAHGMIDTIRRFVWSGDMLARTLGGAYHPIIHLGYAVEFNLPPLAAEGLAMAACTSGTLKPVIPDLGPAQDHLTAVQAATSAAVTKDAISKLATDFADTLGFEKKKADEVDKEAATDMQESLKSAVKNNAIVSLAEETRRDRELDGVVKFKDESKLPTLLENEKAVRKMVAYASRWKVHESLEDIQAKLRELYEGATLCYAASGIREQGVKLDFFLVHAVTSIHAVHSLVPYLSPKEAALLLQGHAATTLCYYVSRGRPSLQVDLLLNYESKTPSKKVNPWLDVIDRAIHAVEVHTIKAVRALALGQIMYGHHDVDTFAKAWLKAAELTLDQNGEWDHNGIGFDEDWQ